MSWWISFSESGGRLEIVGMGDWDCRDEFSGKGAQQEKFHDEEGG
jgi:hypothetical protein